MIENRNNEWHLWVVAVSGVVATTLALLVESLSFLILIPVVVLFLLLPLTRLASLMAFMVPFNVVRETPLGIPFAMELIKFPAFVLLLGQSWVKKTRLHIPREYKVPLALIVVVLALSLARAEVFPFSVRLSVRLLGNVLAFLFILNVIQTREQLASLLRVLLISATIVAVYGIYQYAIEDFGAPWAWVNQRFSTEFAPGRETFWNWRERAMSFLTSENELGSYLVSCIPLVIVRLLAPEQRKRKAYILCLLLLLACLVLTFSLGSWGSLACALAALFVIAFPRFRFRILVLAVLFLLLMSSVYFYPAFQSRLGLRLSEFDWSAYTRSELASLAVRYFMANPILGIGYGNFVVRSGDAFPWLKAGWLGGLGTSSHNMYLTELAEMGLLGFVAFNWVLLLTVVKGVRVFRQSGDWQLRWSALAITCSIIATLAHGVVDDTAFFSSHAGYLIWILAGAQVSIAAMAAKGSSLVGTGLR